jgi:hypothetical protein
MLSFCTAESVGDFAVTGMGAALAAAMDSESRLDTEPSFCEVGWEALRVECFGCDRR